MIIIRNKYFLVISIAIIAFGVFFLLWREEIRYGVENSTFDASETTQLIEREVPVITPSETPISLALPSPASEEINILQPRIVLFSAAAVPDAAAIFDFSAYIPMQWRSLAVTRNESISIYDPSATDASELDRSQIFIRHFAANSFVTLSSVKVFSRTDTIISGRPAVDYIIEKKAGYPNFPNQPAWRNVKHRVVDVRVSDSNPSAFFVIAKRPDLPDAVFDAILATLVLSPKNLVFRPIEGFSEQTAKKPFGIFITPDNSPITPEKFSGFHTGFDVEISEAISATAQIPVFAMSDGEIVRSGKAKGYGGVIAIRHSIENVPLLGIYGHLNPRSLLKLGVRVKAGQRIGYLGKTYSAETDGERRHLHFGIYTGDDMNISGYVTNESDLSRWLDPVKFFAEKIL